MLSVLSSSEKFRLSSNLGLRFELILISLTPVCPKTLEERLFVFVLMMTIEKTIMTTY